MSADRWIPVSEGLPPPEGNSTDSAYLLVTVAEPDGERHVETDSYSHPHDGLGEHHDGEWLLWGDQVVAWLPKPQPWAGDASVTAQEGDGGAIGGELAPPYRPDDENGSAGPIEGKQA